MGGVILMLIISVLFIAMGVFLLLGKGAFLIAGYNMASKEEKEKYDEKKLCRVTGALSFIVGIMCAVLTVLSYMVEKGKIAEETMGPVAIIFTVLVFIGVAVDMVLSNKYCIKK